MDNTSAEDFDDYVQELQEQVGAGEQARLRLIARRQRRANNENPTFFIGFSEEEDRTNWNLGQAARNYLFSMGQRVQPSAYVTPVNPRFHYQPPSEDKPVSSAFSDTTQGLPDRDWSPSLKNCLFYYTSQLLRSPLVIFRSLTIRFFPPPTPQPLVYTLTTTISYHRSRSDSVSSSSTLRDEDYDNATTGYPRGQDEMDAVREQEIAEGLRQFQLI